MRALAALALWALALPAQQEVALSLLAERCLACHSEQNNLGGLSLETREAALKGGAGGPSIVLGDPARSSLVERMRLPLDSAGAMPPGGPSATADEIGSLVEWIDAGAPWSGPLSAREPAAPPGADGEELELVRRIRALVAARAESEPDAPTAAYNQPVPGSDVSLRMIPIPAGEFLMGTPADETGRGEDEGPQVRVRLEGFWMAAREVSWDAFREFMLRESAGRSDPEPLADAVSSPTPPYMEMSFGMGISGYPAISMTQHAASKYAQWLSAKTGRFYRLPTEAEWEYACRAGSQAAYAFGDDPSALADAAWYWDNSGGQYGPVGAKDPNAWGLHDMHGNVWEWTLDAYRPVYGAGPLSDPWVRAERLYPRVVRGGSWMDDAPALRCGSRRASSEDWKMQDPQLPKSVWYHTDAQWLGFRLVRPARLPSAEQMYAYWNSAAGAR
ncbi:MAG: SUMF1/EgtB/PvdO family nonheme iron enzyme [Bryobacterales bacterium]|nr:SUMF1/EgtB/PvdO family nonheme iron enzyme [Bryobacterales bacterium]